MLIRSCRIVAKRFEVQVKLQPAQQEIHYVKHDTAWLLVPYASSRSRRPAIARRKLRR